MSEKPDDILKAEEAERLKKLAVTDVGYNDAYRLAMRMVNGRFPLPEKPGLGFELTEAALKKHPFGGTKPMARVFHQDGSVAAW